MVPTVYQQVKEFIYACLKFSEDLNLSQVEVDEMIRKSVNLLLTRTFSGCLSSTFRSPRINLQEIIQTIIDTGYLEEATVYLEEFISNITGYAINSFKMIFVILSYFADTARFSHNSDTGQEMTLIATPRYCLNNVWKLEKKTAVNMNIWIWLEESYLILEKKPEA